MVEILVEEGETIEVGKPIARIETDAASVSEIVAAEPTAEPESSNTPDQVTETPPIKTESTASGRSRKLNIPRFYGNSGCDYASNGRVRC